MEERNTWTRHDLHCGITVFQNIQTAFGPLSSVYLGPGGAFVRTERLDAPEAFCVRLKDLLHTTRILLYADEQGLYDPNCDSFGATVSPEELDAMARHFVSGSNTRFPYAKADLEAMCDRLIRADAFARGWYCDREGRVYLRRGTVFREASPVDADGVYYLALFGGVLGLHRFSMGKFFSGVLYLFTGGLLLFGWAIDLLFLLLGYQQDGRKRLLCPPGHRLRKLFLLPLGLLSSLLILFVIRSMILAIFRG